jgi:hypothetical protein
MRNLFGSIVAAAVALAVASPSPAAVLINSSNVGYSFTTDYTGLVGGGSTALVGGLSTFTFTGLSNSGLTYNFNYSITNDSSVTSRLTAFGFDVDPNVSGASSTGTYASANLNNNFPSGVGTVDVCFEADSNGNCTGGSAGLTSNQTGTGSFALTFSQVMASVSLDSFVTRFQSINPKINGSSSGVGIGSVISNTGGNNPIVAPEPATWMMLMTGFLLIGGIMRRKRSGLSGLRLSAAHR